MNQKSYDGSPTLYLVPTPIGNLGDFTFRAVEVLNQVEVIFSEDTRVTINLLNHYDIKKKLIAFHKFNEEQKVGVVLSYLEDGKSVAIVSDRGTPVLSDPGEICTKKVIEKGYNVVSLPGATAAIPAITASGLESSKFIFYGFLNSKSSKRKKELEFLKNNKMTIIFYEAPHRIMEMLADLKEIFGDRKISISREISKKFEEIYRAKISEVMNMLTEVKGEFVIVVEGNKDVVSFDDITIKEHVNMYMEDGLTEKDAIKKVAKERNMSKSDVYKEVKINN